MSKTKAEIVKQALFELQEWGSGQPIDADDADVFNLDDVAAYLKGLRVADLTIDIAADALGDEWFFPFSELAAAKYAKGFGLSQEAASAKEAIAINALRVIANRIRPIFRMQFERMTY